MGRTQAVGMVLLGASSLLGCSGWAAVNTGGCGAFGPSFTAAMETRKTTRYYRTRLASPVSAQGPMGQFREIGQDLLFKSQTSFFFLHIFMGYDSTVPLSNTNRSSRSRVYLDTALTLLLVLSGSCNHGDEVRKKNDFFIRSKGSESQCTKLSYSCIIIYQPTCQCFCDVNILWQQSNKSVTRVKGITNKNVTNNTIIIIFRSQTEAHPAIQETTLLG